MSIFAKKDNPEGIVRLATLLKEADGVLVGAGAGLSTAAGFTYSGERFRKYFSDFERKYQVHDMYSLGFYPYSSLEELWGYWCRNIWINRYMPIPNDVYSLLLSLVKGKDYFVLTTNVDHCFQKAGFEKERLFYTQGDYGLFQSSEPEGRSTGKTYDNKASIERMLLDEGFRIAKDGTLLFPEDGKVKTTIASDLVPYCPDDGKPMTTNLRVDDLFVEDEGWKRASRRYQDFLSAHRNGKTLYLELGVGSNTPVIIKYPFWRYTLDNPESFYVCVNQGEAYAPEEISGRSLCLNADIRTVLSALSLHS